MNQLFIPIITNFQSDYLQLWEDELLIYSTQQTGSTLAKLCYLHEPTKHIS